MEENKFLKIFSLCAFVLLGVVSCWATSESLHLLLSSWPAIMCWVVTIAFFVIASYGTKLIVDSLNQNIYNEKRGANLIFGFILVILFWLFCSMPTNTHTFFFRSTINQVVSQDICTTKNYLSQLINNTVTEEKIQAAQTKLENDVNVLLGQLKAEIKNDANPGFGPKAKEILRGFADLLGVAKVEPLSYRGTSEQQRNLLVDAYRRQIYTLMDSKKENIKRSFLAPNQNVYKKQAAVDIKNLEIIGDGISDKSIDINNSEDVEEINKRLSDAYATIKSYKQYINFQSQEDEEAYTAPNQITKVKRMISVFDVWKDFIDGKYAGHGFIFWIIISILVDVAAFIFFDIAFKKRD